MGDHMGRGVSIFCVAILALSLQAQEQATPYTLKVAVDEVSLTFHASDWQGVAMDDLKLSEFRLTDNGKRHRQIVSFDVSLSLPVRVGILVDTSRSVLEDLRRNQWVATEYLHHLFGPRDRRFVMRFDSQDKVVQDWTSNRQSLVDSVRNVAAFADSRMGGTALFDAVYKACRDEFRKTDKVEAGNFILLFSDGVDNASHARMEDDVTMCQSSNTAIYVFSNESGRFLSEGQKVLRQLAVENGGRMFFDQKEPDRWRDLQMLNSNLRNQYRLVYKPEHLNRDGTFHRVKLDSPRGGLITMRSGYYATPQL